MAIRGFAVTQIPKIRDNFGNEWMGPVLTRKKEELENVPNSPTSSSSTDILGQYTVYFVGINGLYIIKRC